MGYEVRALTFGEILDTAFRILRDHFALLVGLAAIAYVPYALLLALAEEQPLLAAGAIVFLMLAYPVVVLALTRAVADVTLGRATSIGACLREAGTILVPAIGTYLIVYLLLILAYVALVVPGIYFSIAWILVGPVIVIERTFGLAAARRSRTLVRGYWWRTAGILLVAGLVVGIVGNVLAVLFEAIPLVGPLLSGLVQAILGAFGGIVPILVYFDLRCRKEDFDLRLLAERIGAPA